MERALSIVSRVLGDLSLASSSWSAPPPQRSHPGRDLRSHPPVNAHVARSLRALSAKLKLQLSDDTASAALARLEREARATTKSHELVGLGKRSTVQRASGLFIAVAAAPVVPVRLVGLMTTLAAPSRLGHSSSSRRGSSPHLDLLVVHRDFGILVVATLVRRSGLVACPAPGHRPSV